MSICDKLIRADLLANHEQTEKKQISDCQRNLEVIATLVQSMCDDFEEMASDCEYFNGCGVCAKTLDGCTAPGCWLPNKKEIKK